MVSKYILVLLTFFMFVGCGSKSLNIPLFSSKNIKDKSLPVVTQINYLLSSGTIAFEWEPSYSSKIDGYKIYRKSPKQKEFKVLTTISNKYSSHYVDGSVVPYTRYEYKFVSYSNNGTISSYSKTISVQTQRRIERVPLVKSVLGLPGQIKILWRPHPNKEISGYIIQKSKDRKNWKDIKTLQGRLQSEFIDTALENSAIYKYRVIATTANGTKSYASQVVVGKTKPLPQIIQNLQISQNLNEKIEISFNKSNIKDKKYYIIYRSIFQHFLYLPIAKIANTFYTDKINTKDKTYFYKVTVVDIDNLESYSQKEILKGKTAK